MDAVHWRHRVDVCGLLEQQILGVFRPTGGGQEVTMATTVDLQTARLCPKTFRTVLGLFYPDPGHSHHLDPGGGIGDGLV